MRSIKPKSIFLQIADRITDSILVGVYPVDTRIPSVRDMAELMEVNPNTVARAYERLQMKGLIYTQRGIGYYVSEGAYDIIFAERKEQFFSKILPQTFAQMRLLEIGIEEVQKAFEEWRQSPPPRFADGNSHRRVVGGGHWLLGMDKRPLTNRAGVQGIGNRQHLFL